MKDERTSKSAENRESRAMNDRQVTEDRAISDAERVEAFRQQMFQSALPDLPKLEGYHLCWLTTTNPRDPIQARLRLGYEPVKPEDIAGWEYLTLKTGEWAGFVGVNEMLAFKLPLSLYEAYMKEAHHNAPLQQEVTIARAVKEVASQIRSKGGRVEMGDGMAELVDERSAGFDL